MASRLVETVLINVEDFADSFLTCGTCLSAYNEADHAPKLLPCSHTVCRVCLERILDNINPHVGPGVFRCPICREGIAVPRAAAATGAAASPAASGADAFPPSFLVNQLRDLLASHRRDLVPKCSQHPTRELLYCETCDQAFCPSCVPPNSHGLRASPGAAGQRDASPSGEAAAASEGGAAGAGGHNVISFGIAMKRMSEILLYKAHICLERLGHAYDSVMTEMGHLEQNEEACLEVSAIFSKFCGMPPPLAHPLSSANIAVGFSVRLPSTCTCFAFNELLLSWLATSLPPLRSPGCAS